MEKTAVIGAGAWGTTLALQLLKPGSRVILWEKFPAYAREMESARENPRFLPGHRLPAGITVTSRLGDAGGARFLVLAVPSFAFRETARALAAAGIRGPFLVATKGLEKKSASRLSQVLEEEIPGVSWSVLSGPNIATEIAGGMPAGTVCAGHDQPLNRLFQEILAGPALRVYTSRDPVGTEIGGALKNPLAIASGIAEGLGLGVNARATLLCRGLAEMARLVKAVGGQPETVSGLSGLGDLVTTCFSPLSRNHRFGVAVGRGERPRDLVAGSASVIEGYHAARPAVQLAARAGVEMPVAREVCRVLFHGRAPRKAVAELMSRPPAGEFQPRPEPGEAGK